MKNLKLLLATTAILSAGVAINANADLSYESVGLDARVMFASPLTAESIKPISFGLLDLTTASKKTMTVNADGTYSGDVKVLGDGSLAKIEPAVLRFTSNILDDLYITGTPDLKVNVADATITLYVVDSSLNPTSLTCGTVDHFVQGSKDTYEYEVGDGGSHNLYIKIGGQLNVRDMSTLSEAEIAQMQSANGFECRGHTTVTYVLWPD